MSSRLLQVLLALSLLLNAFVLAGFIYRSWIAPPDFGHHAASPPSRGHRLSGLEIVTRELDLDESQREALKAVFDQYATVRGERQRAIQKVREQLAAEYKNPTVDRARVDALIDELTKIREEFLRNLMHSLGQMEPHLRPEQRERMHQVLAERLAAPRALETPGGAGTGTVLGAPVEAALTPSITPVNALGSTARAAPVRLDAANIPYPHTAQPVHNEDRERQHRRFPLWPLVLLLVLGGGGAAGYAVWQQQQQGRSKQASSSSSNSSGNGSSNSSGNGSSNSSSNGNDSWSPAKPKNQQKQQLAFLFSHF